MKSFTIARRFCGPPDSSNGGYFAGNVAGLATQACGNDAADASSPSHANVICVRLLTPPPLATELELVEIADGRVEVRHGSAVIAEAGAARLDLDVPEPPTYLESVEASRGYAGFASHRFPTCFVCGPRRQRGDGLRIFAGGVPGRELVAAPWVPDASLDRGDGKVRPEFMAAALDCPGYFSIVSDDRMLLLGQLTLHVDRLVHVGESCRIVGWRLGGSGRKFEAGTAIFDGDGELCGRARAVWIEPRTAATAPSVG